MSPYEARLQHDLDEIKKRIKRVSALVRTNLSNSLRALLREDRALANETVLADLPVNREIRAIDAMCHAFVARHLPSAGHLRFVSSVLRLTIGIERIGDYASTISREVSQLDRLPRAVVVRDIELIAEQAQLMFSQSIKSFLEGNADLARGTKVMESQIDLVFRKVFDDLLAEGDKGTSPVSELFALLSVFNALERVSDQAKNICEETVFSVEGKTKAPKTYRVLFVERGCDQAAPLALAFVRKAFPGSIAASAAGWAAAEDLADGLATFLEERGYGVAELAPAPFDLSGEELEALHVIIGLEKGISEHLPTIPFHTVYLEWDIPGLVAEARKGDASGDFETLHRVVGHKIRELVEVLRGEGAD